MNIDELVSKELFEKVPSDWWDSEDGRDFLRRQAIRKGWIEFLSRFRFDVWFTLTFRDGATSASLAIDRAKRLLKRACKRIGIECDAFIVAEEHQSGTYHCHGMLRVGLLSGEFEKIFLHYFWSVSFKAYGRNSFEPIGETNAVLYYVSKYLVKHLTDYQIIGCKDMARPLEYHQ